MSARVIGTPPAAFRHLYALPRNGRVTVQNLYGNVSITGVGSRRRTGGGHQAFRRSAGTPADARIVVEPTVDSLSIRTQYAGSDAQHPTSVEYRLTVPRRIHLEGVLLTNGQLSLNGLSGPVKASAINGDIHALKLGGQADLSTVNGRVEADFERISPSNPILLSSVNGSIDLTIPPGSGASLEAQNLSGGIASDVGRVARTDSGHRLLVKGTGPRIRLHNVNGGISIRSTEHPCT